MIIIFLIAQISLVLKQQFCRYPCYVTLLAIASLFTVWRPCLLKPSQQYVEKIWSISLRWWVLVRKSSCPSPPIWLFVKRQQQLWGGSCRQRPLTWRKRNTSAVFYQDSHINNSAAPVICKWLNLLTCRDQFASILGLFRPNSLTILLLQYIPLLFFAAFFSINTVAVEAKPSSGSNTWSAQEIWTTFYFVL